MTNTTIEKCRIVVDAMGGDYAPRNAVLGAIEAAINDPHIELILTGKESDINSILKENNVTFNNFNIEHAEDVISMNDSPAAALKTKTNSSMHAGAKLVKEGNADAIVSAGNTGAMLAVSTLLMGRIEGVGRPAIGAALPTMSGKKSTVYDVGASVDCKPAHLLEYGILGTIYCREMLNVENPTVVLLNVGEEKEKGNELVKSTDKLLRESNLNYKGSIEGRDVLTGEYDVILCDGFIGNILLKFAESVLTLLKTKLRSYADEGLIKKLKVLSMRGTLKDVLKDFDYQTEGGVPLLGVNGISIIGHGSSSVTAIKNMVFKAKEMHEKDLINKFQQSIGKYGNKKENV